MDRSLFDARAWVIWVVAAAATTMLVRNPFYILIILLGARLVDQICSRSDSDLNLPFVRLTVVVLLFSGAFNGLFVHRGETVLFHLPAHWPLIGGPITLEAFAFGALNGLIILSILSLFLAFNRIVPVSALARLAPRAYQDLGVVVLLALTYVPETARHMRRIREAQAVRGHHINGLRDWRPLVVPLLMGSMERAMSLAEAMVARGYGAPQEQRQQPRLLAGMALSLGLVLLGWIAALWWGPVGWFLLAMGVGLVILLAWNSGRRVRSTRYRAVPWRVRDTFFVVTSFVPLLLVIVPWSWRDAGAFTYSPYPQIQLPSFNPLLGVAFLLYVAPAIAGFLGMAAPREETNYDRN